MCNDRGNINNFYLNVKDNIIWGMMIVYYIILKYNDI